MRRILLICFALSVLFFSCKKEYSPTHVKAIVNGKNYNVKFNFLGFTQTILNKLYGKTSNALYPSDTSGNDSLNVLYYCVYQNTGSTQLYNQYYLEDKQFNSTNGVFAPITDSLKIGTYYIVFAAGKTGFTYSYNASGILDQDSFSYNGLANSWHDTFGTALKLNFSGNDTTININMHRVVCELQVDIKDALPANIDHIILNLKAPYQYLIAEALFYLPEQTPVVQGGLSYSEQNYSYTHSVPSSAIGKTNYTTTDLLLGDSTSVMNVEVMAYDSSSDLIGDATVSNVPCVPNTKIVLSGNLFGNGGQGNTVGLNSQWQAIPYKTIGF